MHPHPPAVPGLRGWREGAASERAAHVVEKLQVTEPTRTVTRNPPSDQGGAGGIPESAAGCALVKPVRGAPSGGTAVCWGNTPAQQQQRCFRFDVQH